MDQETEETESPSKRLLMTAGLMVGGLLGNNICLLLLVYYWFIHTPLMVIKENRGEDLDG